MPRRRIGARLSPDIAFLLASSYLLSIHRQSAPSYCNRRSCLTGSTADSRAVLIPGGDGRDDEGGGVVIVLDYDQAANAWAPEPPRTFRVFYRAFLDWRRANGWDNEMASHLPALF